METAKQRAEMRKFIAENISESKEAREILGVTRQRLNAYVKDGRIKPIRTGIYLISDLKAFSEAFSEARKEGKWLKDFK